MNFPDLWEGKETNEGKGVVGQEKTYVIGMDRETPIVKFCKDFNTGKKT